VSSRPEVSPVLLVQVPPPPPRIEAAAAPAGGAGPGRIVPLWKRLGIPFWLAVGWIVLVAVLAITASILPLQNPDVGNFSALSQGPSAAHWFGTDDLGRDLMSRVIFGSRVSLIVGFAAAFLGTVIGGALGIAAGYLRSATEGVIMLIMDAIISFPSLVMLIALTTFLGKNLVNITGAIALVTVPVLARLARGSTLSVAKRPFILAARSAGATNFRVMWREIVPNVLPPLISLGLVIVAVAIVAEGALSFLGFSIPPPTPTWGNIIASGENDLSTAPQIVFAPAAVMFVTVFAFSIAGDRLRRIGELQSGGI